jgi:type VI secretion system protein ImpA
LMSLDATRRQQRIDAGVVPFEETERDARTVGLRALTKLRDDARVALEAWEAMGVVIDEKAGDDAPASGEVRDLLETIATIARRYAPEEHAPAGAVAATEAYGGGAGDGVESSGRTGVARPISSREDALKTLASLASFFRQTEPHSPLSYTLDEAVRRARMPWPELLEEVVSDSDTRNAILTSLGIRPPPPPE